MESLSFSKFNLEDQKPMFPSANETQSAPLTPSSPLMDPQVRSMGTAESSPFSPMAAPFQSHASNDLLNLLGQKEPRPGDPAPSPADMEEMLNFRMPNSDLTFDDIEQNPHSFYNMGGSRTESLSSNNANLWNDGSSSRNGEMIDTFDFLVKSLSSANNYVSMLTREQLSVLRSIRPSLLYEFLQEVAKVRSDKRMRRVLPYECAFCKNNGENEECYASHALKDWRGRVLCPVLRAFRCPRCGATGERAHTIKYCPDNSDADRAGNLSAARRRMPSATLLTPPASQPSQSSLWSTFRMN